jgi:homoserine O-acetyltransferase
MITYRSGIEFDERFGARPRGTGRATTWSITFGDRATNSSSGSTHEAYVALMGAMDAHDLGDLRSPLPDTRARVAEVVGVGIDSDIFYYPREVRDWVRAYGAAGVNAKYKEISSPYGHDAFSLSGNRWGGYCAQPRNVSRPVPGSRAAAGSGPSP